MFANDSLTKWPAMLELRWSSLAAYCVSAGLAVAFALGVLAATPAHAATPKVGNLGVLMINDNEGLDPLSDAERARIAALEKQFTEMLTASGRYAFTAVPADTEKRVKNGQMLGECGGCEVAYGKELGTDLVAWIIVQKVSNLILNMNVYMVDVKSNKMAFHHSVDIRGNTDETWSRSLSYLVRNYLLDQPKT